MRQIYAIFAVLVLFGAARLGAQPCTPSDTALCLSGSRFRVEVAWKDFQERTGQGQAVSLTSDTGYFWFFDVANVELVVKVLDARALNGKFWVFFGALSNVEYTLTVRDTVTGSTKSYQNPSGRFASVGDTTAFEGASVVASHSTVTLEGTDPPPASLAQVKKFLAFAPAAARAAPCPATRFGFLLSGCRFHIEVEWDDGRGRTGLGRPVELTNDTGYFWFFSPSNVELIVKVLDARPINGKFWVFFGALSNVEYSITVTDAVTGSVKRYRNPSGTFASVGDTDALRGGFSVASVREAGTAVSADLDPAGGTITATGRDGTVFSLELPPDALPQPQTVTLTPVSRIDRLPFSGGLIAAVEIEPDGLDLMVPATLTIRPATIPPVDRTLPFAYSSGGEDFILYPRNVDTSSLRLPLVRLGGFGAGQGGQAEAASQAGRPAAGALSPYLQRYAYEVFLRTTGQISQNELMSRGILIYREAWDEVVAPLLNRARQSAAIAPLSARRQEGCDLTPEDFMQMLGLIKQKQMLGIEDPDTGRVENGLEEAREYLRGCQQEAFDRCVALTDPFEIQRMAQIARQLQVLGEEDLLITTFIEGGLLERCVRFELDFESKIVEEGTLPGVSWVQRLKYRAQRVPLRFDYGGNPYASRGAWDGACTLRPEVAEYTETTGCTVTAVSGSGWFSAPAAWIGVDVARGCGGRGPAGECELTTAAVRLFYEPGDPQVRASAKCLSGAEIPDFQMSPFANQYLTLHQNELSAYGLYVAKNWEMLRFGEGPSQNGEFFAKKSYQRTIPAGPQTLTEETWFFLKHTPDAPMPACP